MSNDTKPNRLKSKRGRKSKKPAVLKQLKEIKSLAEEGFTEKEIAKFLGIGLTIFYEIKRDYPEFAEALQSGRRTAIEELEKASYKTAMGYEYEEVTTTLILDEDGNPTKRQREVRKKHQPGNPAMQQYLLNNWTKGKYTKDPLSMQFKEEELKLKKDAAKYSNF